MTKSWSTYTAWTLLGVGFLLLPGLVLCAKSCVAMNEQQNGQNSLRRAGLVTMAICGGLATGIVAVALPFVWPAFRKVVLPYVPATSTQVENVLQALRYKRPHLKNARENEPENIRTIDLGSGDGRIVNIYLD